MPVYGYDVYGNSRLSATGVSDASDRFSVFHSGERGKQSGLSFHADESAWTVADNWNDGGRYPEAQKENAAAAETPFAGGSADHSQGKGTPYGTKLFYGRGST